MLRIIFTVFLFTVLLAYGTGFCQEQKNTAAPQQQAQPAANPTQQQTQPPAVAATSPANAVSQPSEAQQQLAGKPQEEVVKGIIKEIAPDSSYIVVEGIKIMTTKEFLEDSYLEVGDNVEITAENTDQGLKAKSYNYIFEEEESPNVGAESSQEPASQDY